MLIIVADFRKNIRFATYNCLNLAHNWERHKEQKENEESDYPKFTEIGIYVCFTGKIN